MYVMVFGIGRGNSNRVVTTNHANHTNQYANCHINDLSPSPSLILIRQIRAIRGFASSHKIEMIVSSGDSRAMAG